MSVKYLSLTLCNKTKLITSLLHTRMYVYIHVHTGLNLRPIFDVDINRSKQSELTFFGYANFHDNKASKISGKPLCRRMSDIMRG